LNPELWAAFLPSNSGIPARLLPFFLVWDVQNTHFSYSR